MNALDQDDLLDAVEIRGALEGLAARLAAEQRRRPAELQPLRECLDALDGVVERGNLDGGGISEFASLDAKFHALVTDLAGVRTLTRLIECAPKLPLSVSELAVLASSNLFSIRAIMIIGQDQHRCLVEAIRDGEGARAESIVREHARLAVRHMVRAGRRGSRISAASSVLDSLN